MNNGDKIRKMSGYELEKILEYAVIYSGFTKTDIRKSNNKFLALMLEGCCNFCIERNNPNCYHFCYKNILEYLDSEVD